jgi:hypothetical protein
VDAITHFLIEITGYTTIIRPFRLDIVVLPRPVISRRAAIV